MHLITIILIAIGLAMDVFAVSVASGVSQRPLTLRHAFKLAAAFGIFQGLMPIIGWIAGSSFAAYITGLDHWLAFGLLGFIGAKMIAESTALDYKPDHENMTNKMVLVLAVATSIDALAVGLSFSFLDTPILLPAIIIAVITFFISLLGVAIGHRLGSMFERKAEFLGGVILIIIGVKILFDHLS